MPDIEKATPVTVEGEGSAPAVQEQSGQPCDHAQWSFSKHGRVCPCGTFMIDWGD